jgi:hypothetical protein
MVIRSEFVDDHRSPLILRHVEKSQNCPAAQQLEFSLLRVSSMAYREFQDAEGSTWTVWDTYPTRPDGMEEKWRGGWLTFENGGVRRRLAPIPKDWSEATAARLELMCKVAEVSSRATPSKGTEFTPNE